MSLLYIIGSNKTMKFKELIVFFNVNITIFRQQLIRIQKSTGEGFLDAPCIHSVNAHTNALLKKNQNKIQKLF